MRECRWARTGRRRTRERWPEMAAAAAHSAAVHEALVGGVVAAHPKGRAGFAGTVRSEFTKIRSVRSTYWTLLALAVACVGIGALFSWGQTERVLRIKSRAGDFTGVSKA